MKIVIAGGTGFIGEPLVRKLLPRADVVVLSRNPAAVKAGRAVVWRGAGDGDWSREVAGADVIINLAGENIADRRWSDERKQRLISSRLDATSALIGAMGKSDKARTFISASAIGYYGNRGDELLDESSTEGAGFLASLSSRWEATAQPAATTARLVIFRLGVVLDPAGGALAKMLPPFKLGLGGPIGSGKQWMSWIDREDVLSLIVWAIDHDSVKGIYNAAAPVPAINRDFVAALGRALHRPAVLPAPAFALKLAFGQMADEALLAGQRVIPRRAQAEGFQFQYPELNQSLAKLT